MADIVEQTLLQYLEECYTMDSPLSLANVQGILANANGKRLSWSSKSEDGLPCLHLAVLNEGTPAEELGAIIGTLLSSGAPPTALDDEGDTALKAVMTLSEDADRPGEYANEEDAEALKVMHVAAVRALLRCPAQSLGPAEVSAVFSWLRRHIPEAVHPLVLKDVEARAGQAAVQKAWSSEELLAYLERKAYDDRAGVDASVIKALLARGAQPDHKQSGATALLLVVLNPYSSLQNLHEVFKAMLQATPGVAAERDGFKLSPLQWAADYTNIASQHGLERPNPAVLLALLPCIVELLPDDIDGGACCLKAEAYAQCSVKAPVGAPSIRFMEGERVVCRLTAPGGQMEWEEGCVTGLWYREPCWPSSHVGAPYEVTLDIGLKVFALVDHDRIIRREAQSVKAPFGITSPHVYAPGGGSGGYPQAKATAAAGGKRFQKQQRPDGSWEMLDNVSGKARPCPEPDSDSD